jgi:hypothetical protein
LSSRSLSTDPNQIILAVRKHRIRRKLECANDGPATAGPKLAHSFAALGLIRVICVIRGQNLRRPDRCPCMGCHSERSEESSGVSAGIECTNLEQTCLTRTREARETIQRRKTIFTSSVLDEDSTPFPFVSFCSKPALAAFHVFRLFRRPTTPVVAGLSF